MAERRAIIIGAGPAGLTAAYELLQRTDVVPVVLEASDEIGGISRTVKYKGNRIDIGGHRFFSKSDRVMNWWLQFMPIQKTEDDAFTITYQNKTRDIEAGHPEAPDPEKDDLVMLVRNRRSRIYYLRKFFDYPISLSVNTLSNLGLIRTMKIGFSYIKSSLFPIKNAVNLEQFFINRFGRQLYNTFFKSYTEKVWGVPCDEISAEWGAQRIKGLSIRKAIAHAVRGIWRKIFAKKQGDIGQKGTETSLIERFLYPKYGPGQIWETVADKVKEKGGDVIMHRLVDKVNLVDGRIASIEAINPQTQERETYEGDMFFSTMPVKDLMRSMGDDVPENVREVSDGLLYRDFITVGLLSSDLKIKEKTPEGMKLVKDNWIYIQEPDVIAGRLQIFNNWSPYLVADQSKVWVGVEYFCYETDDLWKMSDEKMSELAKDELDRIDIIDAKTVEDSIVIRVPKTYPAYFGTYDRFDEVREFVDNMDNLFLIGRNGMHRYNNQDHSMLAAMTAVDNIAAGKTERANIWDVNTEQEYHEQKEDEAEAEPEKEAASATA